ncbi:Uncharacterized membrane protein [Pelagirhabdus alkalitolerans]|uniref:Uncharacterized membrane protein n=1 Tax=Pelagirhabdus alkalitolerans TaxID=1612202 RepID=A0A1G6GII9_9BACI|nr:DUF1700 domain-containing protein [Pelagirhabdus alkalitolerans]SDB81822.1 Uncharacterized membrane protein [Pelagirhabdus alkalitolerans]
MQKKRYLSELSYHLRGLPKAEREEVLNQYKETFSQDEALGIDPVDTIIKLGSAKRQAEIELEKHSQQTEEHDTYHTTPLNIPALILLIIVNLIFVAPAVFALAIVSLTFWAISIGFMATPFLTIWQTTLFQMPEIFILLLLFGIGTLLFVSNYYAVRGLFWLGQHYFNWMNQWVKG